MLCEAIDLFCGVGGLTNGLERAGIRVVAGIDFEHSCKYAYEKNNKSKFIEKDITLITDNELKSMYSAEDDNTEVLYFEKATATFYSFTDSPREIEF